MSSHTCAHPPPPAAERYTGIAAADSWGRRANADHARPPARPLPPRAQDLARAGQPPVVLLDCLRFLAVRGLQTPALWSSGVDKRRLLALKEAYDAGRRAVRGAKAARLDAPTVANLLLLWLGSLPEPLFPAEFVPALLASQAAAAGRGRGERLAAVRAFLKQVSTRSAAERSGAICAAGSRPAACVAPSPLRAPGRPHTRPLQHPPQTEPFIVEALFPLFELLHHYWINQPARAATLADLGALFAPPVFGAPGEHGAGPEAAALLAATAELMIEEYRPLFTQPYNLQRYDADLARQAAAAAAAAATAEAAAAAEAAPPPPPGALAPVRCTPWRAADPSYRGEERDASPLGGSWYDSGSPLLTPRRLGGVSVMFPAPGAEGCSSSPEQDSPDAWARPAGDRAAAAAAAADDDVHADVEMAQLLDCLLADAVSAAFGWGAPSGGVPGAEGLEAAAWGRAAAAVTDAALDMASSDDSESFASADSDSEGAGAAAAAAAATRGEPHAGWRAGAVGA
jgi:hypothetical protein